MTSLFSYFLITLLSLNNTSSDASINNNKNLTNMKFEMPTLPYATNALEPVISQQTIELHYGKHLQTYVNNLNNLVPGTKFENSDLISIIKESDGPIFNNAGQILNHDIYFSSFAPNAGGEPTGKLAEAIAKEWGSFDNFKKEFNTAGAAVFGSGWVFLAKDASGSNPVTKGLTPLLGFDVWEHAYYLDYQNRRADHLVELWKIINWTVVGARY
jgi:Fe-Mn family superoxide dismutase